MYIHTCIHACIHPSMHTHKKKNQHAPKNRLTADTVFGRTSVTCTSESRDDIREVRVSPPALLLIGGTPPPVLGGR